MATESRTDRFLDSPFGFNMDLVGESDKNLNAFRFPVSGRLHGQSQVQQSKGAPLGDKDIENRVRDTETGEVIVIVIGGGGRSEVAGDGGR